MQLPDGFLEMVRKYPELCILETSLHTDPEISIRINNAKYAVPSAIEHADHVPWCREGFYLSERPAFTFDPALHQGLYYVQDASSMAITEAIKHIVTPDQPVRYLDACAAPGGKTTAAIASLPEGSVVVANEYDYHRAEILAENLAKWGNPNVLVSRGDTSKLKRLRHYFDIVAVDAPCSGEGMMRKEEQAIRQWSPSLIEQCALTQRQILTNAWEALRPGGHLIYSTCTFNLSEDEDNVAWLLDNYDGEAIDVPKLSDNQSIVKGINTPYPCYRFIPGKVRGEGLFICVIKKTGNSPATNIKTKSSKPNPQFKDVYGWFNQSVELVTKGDIVYALPKSNAAFLIDVASKLDTILIGVEAATIKGRDIIPSHQLVLSTALNPKAFNIYEVDYHTAIKYLQKEAISLDDVPKGYVVITYEGKPLGIVKNLGNRSNNLLPKSWRILSKSIPEIAPDVLRSIRQA